MLRQWNIVSAVNFHMPIYNILLNNFIWMIDDKNCSTLNHLLKKTNFKTIIIKNLSYLTIP